MSEANKPLVTIVLGTRLEANKLAPVIRAFRLARSAPEGEQITEEPVEIT
ncbi:MAG: hypothetical protein ACO3PB_00795 [Miltoncostaeaceae bacterium]